MICSKCLKDKDENMFPFRKNRNGDIVKRKQCKSCRTKHDTPRIYIKMAMGVINLSDRYVLNKLNHNRNKSKRHIFTKKDVEIIEIKRQLLKLKRTIKAKTNENI